jgi:NAD(P)-dependent dehydrogenase (short-subunit alcohol dehydrogenase family)
LLGLTRSLALEYAPTVRVLAVAPGGTDTPTARRAMGEFAAAGMTDIGTAAIERMPLGRLTTPDEAARAVLFAVSDLGSGMTGSAIFVDAGAMLL